MTDRSLTVKYGLANFFYFACLASCLAFASSYMLYLGFSNSAIGAVLALCAVICLAGQPAAARFSDKHPSFTIQQLTCWMLAGVVLLSAVLWLVAACMPSRWLLLLLIVCIFSVIQIVMPFMNTLAFVFEKFGISIDYGAARGCGSIAYALTSMILGFLVEAFSESILPFFYALFGIVCWMAVKSYRLKRLPAPADLHPEKSEVHRPESASAASSLSFGQFVKKYPVFIVFMLGFALIYTDHMIINNFYIQIIENVGGSSANMGVAVFIGAGMELPTMLAFSRLDRKFGTRKLLTTAAIVYSVKHLLTFMAVNVWMIYLASFLQCLAYGLFTPAAVYYVNAVIAPKDRVMGQSVNTMSFSFGSVLGSLAGGILLDLAGVHGVLLAGLVLSIMGTVLCCLTVQKKRSKTALCQ